MGGLSARIAFGFLMAAGLSGCVVGQKLPMDSTPGTTGTAGAGHSAGVVVEDRRPAVVSGDHPPWRVGQYRAAAGIPWPVTTDGKRPLADLVRADVEEELAALGFTIGPGGGTLEVLIDEWDFTGYQNGRFWYRLQVRAKDSQGLALASVQQAEEVAIKGTLMLGARGGFERDMPGIYTRIIDAIVNADPAIVQALAARLPAPP